MMHQLNKISLFFYRPDWGYLLIRVATGLIFMYHGWMKIGNIEGSVGFMGMLGIPAALAYLAIIVELIGGAMIVLGVFTRAAAVATGIVALTALTVAVAPSRGWLAGEFEFLLAMVSFGIALSGAGRIRLLHMFEHDRTM